MAINKAWAPSSSLGHISQQAQSGAAWREGRLSDSLSYGLLEAH